MANKRKTTTAIVAGVTALALMLGGTFAWTSIQQEARNEAIVDINPGGRLHDDFDGRNLATAGVLANKDVYVENFGDDSTGVPIFARIRLDQYMEIGQEAGVKGAEGKRAAPLMEGTDIDTLDGWTTYIPGSDAVIDESNPFFEYWGWTLGNDSTDGRYYMPTFNKNKDSLKADINGTYEGTVDGDIVHYDDYVAYDADSSVTADATYDWDDDTDEDYDTSTNDRTTPIDDADVLLEEETHNGTELSSTASVILMSDYMAMGEEERASFIGWVYDTDGWAYWSQPIAPGQTTGLLLDGVTMSKVPDDNWYYSINVVGQFATASDWTMLYVPTEENGGGSMTEDAKALMESITGATGSDDEGQEPEADWVSIGYSAADYFRGYLAPGGSLTLVPTAFIDGEEYGEGGAQIDNSDVEWSITNSNSDSTTVDENNKLTIGADEAENKVIIVTVEYKGLTDEFDVYITSKDITTEITSNADSYETGKSYQMSATVKRGDDDVSDDEILGAITWDVFNENYEYVEGVEITEEGEFTASVAGSYIISANPAYGPGATLEVTVTAAESSD